MASPNRYVIVGSGAAGFAALEAIRARDPHGKIQWVTSDPHRYYSRPGLAYYLLGEIPEEQLFPANERLLRDLKFEWVQGHAAGLDPAGHRLKLQDGRTLTYERLLLAPGAIAQKPEQPGIDLEGVLTLDSLTDAQEFLRRVKRGSTAIVVGGGITALELVEALAGRGAKVHYFLRGDRFWSAVLDEVESRLVESRLAHDGVKLHYNTSITDIVGKKGRVAGVNYVENDATLKMDCDLVFVAIGVRPRMEVAVSGGVAVKKGILVNEKMETNVPDVYAAGDAAQVFDPRTGEHGLDSLWQPASSQGKTAGVNMAGDSHVYLKESPVNVTRLAGLVTTIIGKVGSEKAPADKDLKGISRGDSAVWRSAPPAMVAQSLGGENRLRLLVGEKAILGAMVIGDQKISRLLQRMVAGKVDITAQRAELTKPGVDLTGIIHHEYGRIMC